MVLGVAGLWPRHPPQADPPIVSSANDTTQVLGISASSAFTALVKLVVHLKSTCQVPSFPIAIKVSTG
jgi:hypothetical protein